MTSTNSRFKGFGFGSKRKSAANPELSHQLPAPVPQVAGQLAGHSVRPGPPPPPSLSQSSPSSSVPMNSLGGGPRPPSYTGYPPGVTQGRTTSPPMNSGPGIPRTPPSQVVGGPAPINTAATGGYPPQHMQGVGGPPPLAGGPQGPPQYQNAPYPPPGQGGMAPLPYAARNNAVEVEGAGRSKSQLIVGIDFVSITILQLKLDQLTGSQGNYFLGRRLRLRLE